MVMKANEDRLPTPLGGFAQEGASHPSYYGNANPDLLNAMALHWRRVCEFGCGSGGLASAYKARNPACAYFGVELFAQAAERAREVADTVLVRNLDQMPEWTVDVEMSAMLPLDSLDAAVFGDVLEHLQDPQAVLRQAVHRLVPGGRVLACIPNVQHWSVFAHLLSGRWPQQDSGLFDRTHLRWFTLSDMVALLQGVGLKVLSASPRYPAIGEPARVQRDRLLALLQPAAEAMGVKDMAAFTQRTAALQYVLVAEKVV